LSWFVLVAALGTNHAKPFGPEMQVKRMLGGWLAEAWRIFV